MTPHPFLLELLALAQRRGAEAIYITPGSPPALRMNGVLHKVSKAAFTPVHTAALVRSVMDASQAALFEAAGELQFALAVDGFAAFPATAFHHDGGAAMRIRLAPPHVPGIEELGLQPLRHHLARHAHGLVLVASPSQALRDAASAALALPAQGTIAFSDEAGDRTVLERALAAATTRRTAVKVVADTVASMLQRLALPDPWRRSLAGALRAAVALQGVPSTTAGREVFGVEVLLETPATTAQLAAGQWAALEETMKRQRALGMQTLDQQLFRLYQRGEISIDEALQRARYADEMQLELKLHARSASTRPPGSP